MSASYRHGDRFTQIKSVNWRLKMAPQTPSDDEDPPIIIIIHKAAAALKEYATGPAFWCGAVLGGIAASIVAAIL
jgi:hypothetical protein